jgi:hypothetical protein
MQARYGTCLTPVSTIPLTLIPVDVFNRSAIARYNYNHYSAYGWINPNFRKWQRKLKQWVQNGGVVIGLENAFKWLNTVG